MTATHEEDDRISLADEFIGDWANRLGVTPDGLRQAVTVAVVGDRRDAVEKYFSEAAGPA